MSVELILSALKWLGLDALHRLVSHKTSIAGKEPKIFAFNWDFDWARV
jgi:hypothetical protein